MTTSAPVRSELRFEVRFPDAHAMEEAVEDWLLIGGIFVHGEVDGDPCGDCEVVVTHPRTDATLRIDGTVVYVTRDGPHPGVGVGLKAITTEFGEHLRAFVAEGRVEEAGSGDAAANMRRLPLAQQLRMARSAALPERVALERSHGNLVWDGILHNPRVTPPEVRRIAGMGTLPLPLVEFIASNEGWRSCAEIRRALLSNPRLRGPSLMRVLRALPKPDLELVPTQASYPHATRQAARQLIRR